MANKSKVEGHPRWKLSRSAAARVLNPLPVPHTCPYCQSEVEAVPNEEIYGKPFGDWPFAYLCQKEACRAYVGMHPRTKIPLGTLANAITRQARTRAKEMFNDLWGPGKMSRTEAYGWLAQHLDITVGRCHFGWFDVKTCQRVMKLITDEKRSRTSSPTKPPFAALRQALADHSHA